jgi:hypothetical protein
LLDQLIAEIPGNKPGAGVVADKAAKELAGKVHNFFSQEEKITDLAILKPLRRPKVGLV